MGEVKVPQVQMVEKIVHVPELQTVERVVEVPQIQIVEVEKEVALPATTISSSPQTYGGNYISGQNVISSQQAYGGASGTYISGQNVISSQQVYGGASGTYMSPQNVDLVSTGLWWCQWNLHFTSECHLASTIKSPGKVSRHECQFTFQI